MVGCAALSDLKFTQNKVALKVQIMSTHCRAAVEVKFATIQVDIQSAAAKIEFKGDAVFLLALEAVGGDFNAAVAVLRNGFEVNNRLPNLGKGLLEAVGSEILLPSSDFFLGHLHGVSHGNGLLSNAIGFLCTVDRMAVLQGEVLAVLAPYD